MADRALPGRWLRHNEDGTIYGYTDVMASNPMVTEVTEEEAWPERFMTESQKDRFSPDEPAPKGKKKKSKKTKLKLDTAEDVIAGAEGPSLVNDGVAADASRGL